MYNTQHDLSFNEAKIDFPSLLRTAHCAYSQTKQALLTELNKDELLSPVYSDYIKKLAENLAIISETVYTLEECKTRENLEIINKP